MRGFGRFLMAVGATVGVAVSLAWMAGVNLPDIPWFVAVGLTKLTLLASIGMIGAGATLVRLDNRRQRRSVTDGEATAGR